MRIVYVGPHIDGVSIPYGRGELFAAHGAPVEVPDDLARGLLEQPSNWQPAKAATVKKEATDEPA